MKTLQKRRCTGKDATEVLDQVDTESPKLLHVLLFTDIDISGIRLTVDKAAETQDPLSHLSFQTTAEGRFFR